MSTNEFFNLAVNRQVSQRLIERHLPHCNLKRNVPREPGLLDERLRLFTDFGMF